MPVNERHENRKQEHQRDDETPRAHGPDLKSVVMKFANGWVYSAD